MIIIHIINNTIIIYININANNHIICLLLLLLTTIIIIIIIAGAAQAPAAWQRSDGLRLSRAREGRPPLYVYIYIYIYMYTPYRERFTI